MKRIGKVFSGSRLRCKPLWDAPCLALVSRRPDSRPIFQETSHLSIAQSVSVEGGRRHTCCRYVDVLRAQMAGSAYLSI